MGEGGGAARRGRPRPVFGPWLGALLLILAGCGAEMEGGRGLGGRWAGAGDHMAMLCRPKTPTSWAGCERMMSYLLYRVEQVVDAHGIAGSGLPYLRRCTAVTYEQQVAEKARI